jgi:hypothetical protein
LRRSVFEQMWMDDEKTFEDELRAAEVMVRASSGASAGEVPSFVGPDCDRRPSSTSCGGTKS